MASTTAFVTPAAAGHGPTAAQVAVAQVVLYSQNDEPFGTGIVSEVFHGSEVNDTAIGADDFQVPSGQSWTVDEVDVTGVYHHRGGRDATVIVRLYAGVGPMPHGVVARIHVQHPVGPSFALALGTRSVTLDPGDYWLSVQVIGPATGLDPFWTWSSRSAQLGSPAVWRNPRDGFGTGCRTWTGLQTCATRIGPDFMFALQGTSS